MPIDCPSEGCRKQLPPSTLIQTNVLSLTQTASTDCAKNMVYLTDDAGFDDAEAQTGAYLNTTDNRFQVLSSLTQVADHWVECIAGSPATKSSVFSDMSYFFQLTRSAGSSPGYVIAVYWDRDGGETIAEALYALYACFRCFRVVTTVTNTSDGVAFYDTTSQLDIQAWTQANRKVYVGKTFDAALSASFTETTSIPAQSNALSYDNSAFTWAGEQCVDELDDTCTETGSTVVEITPTDLAYAAILASYSSDGTTYIPDPFLKPYNGIPGQQTADLTQSEVINVTGTDINQGGQISDATRYANVYHDIAGRAKGFLYGSNVTGYQSYDIMQSLYIQDYLDAIIIDYLNQYSPAGISNNGLKPLENLLIAAAQRFTRQGIITPDESDFSSLSPIYNIIDQANGWILARQSIDDLSLAELSQGFTPQYFFCYVNQRTMRFVMLSLCSLLKPEQIAVV